MARECAAMGHAIALAEWIGDRPRQVTAGQVLRRADVAEVGAALGVSVPGRVRTAADVRPCTGHGAWQWPQAC